MLHKLDASEIKRLMIERGYSAQKMAKAVGVDAKTLRRWLDGEAAQTENVARLAETLGTVPSALIAKDSATPEEPPKEKRVSGIILRWEVEIPEANMNSPQVAAFLTKVAAAIGALSPIILLAVGQGSLLLTLEMSDTDVHSLIAAFIDGKLDELQVYELSFQRPRGIGFDDLTHDIRALAIKLQQENVVRSVDEDFTQSENES